MHNGFNDIITITTAPSYLHPLSCTLQRTSADSSKRAQRRGLRPLFILARREGVPEPNGLVSCSCDDGLTL